ncbi:MAG: Planctomycete cytochrome, partial [Armatimonadetes bacterium]|nr:Planctomycete cytochrome [Armatimonadota bacterium]
LHKLICLSYAYRQASAPDGKGMAVDAGNQLLWRMPLRRLDAEAMRDAILATSGKLDRTAGGPSFQLFKYRIVNVAIYEPREEYGPETWRRSVYRQAARGFRDDLLGTFDCPETAQRTPRRPSTTTALQALSLLNGPFMTQQAGFLAERVQREAGAVPAAQITRAFQLAFGRLPTGDEQRAAADLTRKHGLPALCRALMNANEFLYY